MSTEIQSVEPAEMVEVAGVAVARPALAGRVQVDEFVRSSACHGVLLEE